MKPKKCRHCREPFTPARPMQKACSPACAIALTKKQAEAAALKKKREDLQKDRAKRHQLKTIPQLIAGEPPPITLKRRPARRLCNLKGPHGA